MENKHTKFGTNCRIVYGRLKNFRVILKESFIYHFKSRNNRFKFIQMSRKTLTRNRLS